MKLPPRTRTPAAIYEMDNASGYLLLFKNKENANLYTKSSSAPYVSQQPNGKKRTRKASTQSPKAKTQKGKKTAAKASPNKGKKSSAAASAASSAPTAPSVAMTKQQTLKAVALAREGSQTHRWEYADTTYAGGWAPYAPEASDLVEMEYQSWLQQPSVFVRSVHSGFFHYSVNFNKMEQTNINHHARRVRAIRRVAAVAAAPAVAPATATAPTAAVPLSSLPFGTSTSAHAIIAAATPPTPTPAAVPPLVPSAFPFGAPFVPSSAPTAIPPTANPLAVAQRNALFGGPLPPTATPMYGGKQYLGPGAPSAPFPPSQTFGSAPLFNAKPPGGYHHTWHMVLGSPIKDDDDAFNRPKPTADEDDAVEGITPRAAPAEPLVATQPFGQSVSDTIERAYQAYTQQKLAAATTDTAAAAARDGSGSASASGGSGGGVFLPPPGSQSHITLVSVPNTFFILTVDFEKMTSLNSAPGSVPMKIVRR